MILTHYKFSLKIRLSCERVNKKIKIREGIYINIFYYSVYIILIFFYAVILYSRIGIYMRVY